MTAASPRPDEAARLLDEWRRTVNHELAETARLHSQAAVTFERVNGRLDEHDRRIAALETAPMAAATNARAAKGLSLQTIALGVMAVSVLLSILSPHIAISLH